MPVRACKQERSLPRIREFHGLYQRGAVKYRNSRHDPFGTAIAMFDVSVFQRCMSGHLTDLLTGLLTELLTGPGLVPRQRWKRTENGRCRVAVPVFYQCRLGGR